MVPPDSFSISAAQAIKDGFSGCAGGTQDDIFSVTVLSWAHAAGGAGDTASSRAAAPRVANFVARLRIGMHVSPVRRYGRLL